LLCKCVSLLPLLPLLLLLLLLQINDRYEFYDELDLDKDDGKYLSPQVRARCLAGSVVSLSLSPAVYMCVYVSLYLGGNACLSQQS
jgi:hypothetical protein